MTDTITLPRAEFEKIKVTLEENNQHHIDYDEHAGYDGSELQEKNLQAITIVFAALAQQAEQVPEHRTLYECRGCRHIYMDKVTSCDCMENSTNEYDEWVATPNKN